MASRNFGDPLLSLDRNVRLLFGRVTFGASSIASQDCLGFTVARASAGTYTVTLDDAYPKSEATAAGAQTAPMLAFEGRLIATALQQGQIQCTSDYNPSTKALTIVYEVGGVATDPATGAILTLWFAMRNTGAPRKGV